MEISSQLYVGVKRADEVLVRNWLKVMMAQIISSLVVAFVYLGFGIAEGYLTLLIWSSVSAVVAGEYCKVERYAWNLPLRYPE